MPLEIRPVNWLNLRRLFGDRFQVRVTDLENFSAVLRGRRHHANLCLPCAVPGVQVLPLIAPWAIVECVNQPAIAAALAKIPGVKQYERKPGDLAFLFRTDETAEAVFAVIKPRARGQANGQAS